MTYGWAILIIAVVLGVLFQLGVFSSASLVPRAQPGNCRVMRLAGMANLEGVCQGELPQFVGQFNGGSSYVNILNSVSLDSNSVTVGFWFQSAAYSGSSSYAGFVSETTRTNGWQVGTIGPTSSQNIFVDCFNAGTQECGANYLTTINLNAWYDMVIVLTQSTVTVYLNGVNIYSKGISAWATPTVPLTLGYAHATGGYLNGQISNVQVYNTSLDANQINALYVEGIGGAPIDPYHIVGWWPLNGDVNDYSGNNNAGTPTNVVYNSQWTSGYVQP